MNTTSISRIITVLMTLLFYLNASSQISEQLETSFNKILDLYKEKDIVLISEHHGNKENHDFIKSFLEYPRTKEVIDDIVVEFGNSKYQFIAEQYISGAKVLQDSLRLIWRNHTIPFTWDSALYEDFFKHLRKINSQNEKQFKLILGDPPIDWNNITSPEEYGNRIAQRSTCPFNLIRTNILDKKRKGLVIMGGVHILSVDLKTGKPTNNLSKASLGQLLKDNYPDSIFSIWPYNGELDEEVSKELRQVGIFKCTNESLIKNESFRVLFGEEIYVAEETNGNIEWVPLEKEKWLTVEEAVDGIIYLGEEHTIINPKQNIYTKKYINDISKKVKVIDEFFGFEYYQERLNQIIKQSF